MDSAHDIQFFFIVFQFSGQFSQHAESHLELTGLDSTVCTPVAESAVAAGMYH
jgi:hypothetical protein